METLSHKFGYVNVAIEGCCHGELDKIYSTIQQAELSSSSKVDLLLICGDFESVRDNYDLSNMAVPAKFRHLNSFSDYVTGNKVAHVPTIVIGGNHEASNVFHSLYYGGYIAPNIYFLGFAGVVWFGGIRICGISGIYNYHNYRKGHFELPPYSEDMIRSIYHVREIEIYRLAHLSSKNNQSIDVFLSHDWPQNIWKYGNTQELLRIKPYFKDDIDSGKLGSPPLMHLLDLLKPSYWFSAHLHVRFSAVVPHFETNENGENKNEVCVQSAVQGQKSKITRFLALDKVLPGRYVIKVFV